MPDSTPEIESAHASRTRLYPRSEPGRTVTASLAVRTVDDTVYAQGILDAVTSAVLLTSLEQLQQVGRSRIRLDLTDVVRIEGEAIRVLFDRQNALADDGGELQLIVPVALRPRLLLCRLEPDRT